MRTTMSTARMAALAAAAATVMVAPYLLAVGCSSTTTNEASCGAGTALQNGVCVVPDAGQADAQQLADVALDGSTDATTSGDVASDAASDSGAGPDTSTSDSSTVSEYDADPCPVNSFTQQYYLNCDPNCQSQEAVNQQTCQMLTCASGQTWSPGRPIIDCQQSIVVRTPSDPGVDPHCGSDCPAAGWVYGMAMAFASNSNTGYSVTVSPPWYLITGTTEPFCQLPDGRAPSNCLWFDGTVGETIYAVTTDPSAPGKDVVLQCASQGVCP